jgi:hypothetical protein
MSLSSCDFGWTVGDSRATVNRIWPLVLVQFVAFMTVAHSMLLAVLLIFVIAARDLKRRGLL